MKLYFLISMLLVSNIAFAENWQFLEDTEAARLIVDVDTVDIDSYGKNKFRVWGEFRLLGAKINLPKFISVIDGDECVAKNAGTIFFIIDEDNISENFWSLNGNKLHDSIGVFLCSTLQQTIAKEDNKSYL